MHLSAILTNVATLPCEMQNSFTYSNQSYIASPKKWMTLRTAGYYAVYQLELQTSNVKRYTVVIR